MLMDKKEIIELLNILKLSDLNPYYNYYSEYIPIYLSNNSDLTLEQVNYLNVMKNELVRVFNDRKHDLDEANINYIYDKFASVFTEGDVGISWYDNSFWSLVFSYPGDWKSNDIYLSKKNKLQIYSYIKENKKPNLFDGITYYLNNKGSYDFDKLYRLWLRLASRKEIKEQLTNQKIYPLALSYPLDMFDENSVLTKISIYALFNKDGTIDKIKDIYKDQKDKPLIQEKIAKVLESLGEKIDEEKHNLMLYDLEEKHIINNKVLNSFSIMKKGNLTEKELDSYYLLLGMILHTLILQTGAQVESKKEDFYILEQNKRIPAFQIKLINQYQFTHEKSLSLLNDILTVATGVYLTEEFKNIPKEELKDYYSRVECVDFFEKYMKSVLLKNKIENSLSDKIETKRIKKI